MRDLYFFHNDNGTYVDYTLEMRDYLRDPVTINFVAAEDELIFGLYKPFNSIYAELSSVAVGANLSFEYSTAASFSSLSTNDDTKDFARSGFITWNKSIDDWAAQNIDGNTLFWIKIKSSTDFSVGIKGFNLLFSDDNDLRTEQREIDNLLYSGDTSFVAYHLSARNEIVQSLRNSGYTTRTINAELYNDLIQWDIHDFNQIRQASKYLTLSKINSDVSQNTEDKYHQRYRDYLGNFQEAFKLYLLSLDRDDNGKIEVEENNFFRMIELIKV